MPPLLEGTIFTNLKKVGIQSLTLYVIISFAILLRVEIHAYMKEGDMMGKGGKCIIFAAFNTGKMPAAEGNNALEVSICVCDLWILGPCLI